MKMLLLSGNVESRWCFVKLEIANYALDCSTTLGRDSPDERLGSWWYLPSWQNANLYPHIQNLP